MPDSELLLFLSHSGLDTEAARKLKQRLEVAPEAREHGLRVWFDKDDLRAGEPWQPQLEEAIHRSTAFAVYVGSRGVVNWVDAEVQLALSRTFTDDSYRFIPILAPQAPGPEALPGFVGLYQGVADVENQPNQFAKLVAAILGRDAAGTAKLEAEPFFGLKAVDEDRAHLFFGREQEIETLIRLLRQESLVMVTGDSGSGKSSLARAGLVPRWRGGALADTEEVMGERPSDTIWHVVQTQPRTRPFQILAEAVSEAAKRLGISLADRGTLEDWARSGDPDQVRRALWCDLPPDRTRVLLLVDQFEELVTIAEPGQREHFVRLLLTLADPNDPRARVVLTMRRDYYNLLSTFPDLYERLEANGHRARQLLGRMSLDGLRRIVTQPLRLAGVPKGDRAALADQVAAEIGDRPGDLALVQMALTETWERRRSFDNDLLRAYAGVGRIEGAIARAAEDVYTRDLDAAERALTEPIFIRLVRLGDTGGATRRLATRVEFDDARWRLVQKLATKEAKRLVLVGGSETGETAEIAHEALVTQWPRYQTWLSGYDSDGNRAADKRTLDALIPRVADWVAAPDARAKAKRLATGADLEAFVELAERRPAWLSAEEHKLVSESREGAVRQQRRDRRLFRSVVAAAIVAIAAAVVAWQQRNHAIAETQRALIAQSRLLLSLSGQSTQNGDSLEGLLLSIEALDLAGQSTQVGDSLKGLLLSIEALPGSGPSGNRPYMEEPELSLRSAYLAYRAVLLLLHGDGAPIGLTLFSPDSAHVLTALGSGIISSESAPARIWDTQTGAHFALEGAISDTHGLSPEELADERWVQTGYARHLSDAVFSRDGMRLLTVLWHTRVKIWDLKSGAATISFGYHSNQRVETAVFSPDEAYVITAFTDGDTTKSRNAEAGGKNFRLSDSATGVAVDEINGAEGLKRIAFSPDGARMVTQDKQDRLTLWDARSRQTIAILNGHQGEVNSVAFSPDGTQIASISSDMTARLWAAESGEELGVLKGHEDSVSLAIFSPSGHQLLTASSDKTARLWNINPLKSSPVSEFKGHEAAVTGAAFNADGSRIITRSEDKTSRLWNANTGTMLAVFQVDKGGLGSSTPSTTAEFSSDGLKVLSFSDRLSSPTTSAHLWSAETGGKLAELGTADEGASFSPDGTRILTVSRESGARLWDSFDGKPYAILSRPGVRVGRAAFSPDGHLVITVSGDTATLWDARQGASFDSRFTESPALTPTPDRSGFEALSPDGKFRVRPIYQEKDSNAVEVVDVAGNRQVARLEGHQKRVSSMAFSAAGTRILTASEDGTARIWSAMTGKELGALRSSAGGFSMAKWSPDDQRVVTRSNRGGVDLWDPRQGKHIAELGGDTRFSSAVWFSADGTRLVTAPFPEFGSTNYPVRIWNAGSGALVSELKGHGDRVESIVFSSNGQRVLTASADKTAKIWDSGTGESLATFNCDGEVESAQFNGDGTRILIQSRDADLKRVTSLWNADSGQRIVQLAVTDSIGALAKFTADGAYVLISSGGPFSGGDTSLWDSKTGKRLAVLRGTQSSEGSREIRYRDDTAVIERSGNPGSTLVLKGHTDRITDGHFSPNDKLAVTASEDGTARLWDAGSGSSKAILNGHRGAVHGAAFSADGQQLITAGEDGTARIWDVSSGAELIVLKGHRSVVRSASLSVDDSRAVTIGEDHTVRQWDVKNGAQLSVSAIDGAMFENLAGRHGFEAPGIAVTPDGTRVLAQGREKLFVVRTFPSTKALLDETMRESVRCLSLEERKTAYLEEEPPAWCIEQGKWPYHTLRWKAWRDAKRAGQNPAYPVAGQQVAAGAHEAFRAGRFEEAMKLQGVLADTFSQATTSVPGGEPATAAWVFAHLSRYALFSKDYTKALSAADRAIELQAEKFLLVGTPDINAIMNKAHALMFLGRADEALALHRKMRGHKIDTDGDVAKMFEIGKAGRPTLWEDGVRADFDRFRGLGMDHPQMAEIEDALVGSSQTLQTVIVRVLPNSQAAQIGLQSGDIIDSYDGERIIRLPSLLAAVRRPGDTPRELIILRDGQTLHFQVAPGPLGIELREIAAHAGAPTKASPEPSAEERR